MPGRRRTIAAPTSSSSSPRCSGDAAIHLRMPNYARARRVTPMNNLCRSLLWCAALASAGANAQLFHDVDAPRGEAVERQLPGDRTFTQWVKDPAALSTQGGDRVELR